MFHVARVPLVARSGKPRGVVPAGARWAYILSMLNIIKTLGGPPNEINVS
jgi:hypothetical protein